MKVNLSDIRDNGDMGPLVLSGFGLPSAANGDRDEASRILSRSEKGKLGAE